MSGSIILISGPVRSGKSDQAEKLAAKLAQGQPVAYIATAQPLDREMANRINRHRAGRPANWVTYEEAFEPWLALEAAYAAGQRVFLLDCLTMLISNWLFRLLPDPAEDQLVAEEEQSKILEVLERLCQRATQLEGAFLIMVTNEVGWSLVPANAFSRLYRDVVGRANRQVAAAAQQVWLVVMGLPQQLK